MEEKGKLSLKAKPAGNFLDYVRTAMDTFEERPLCTVDSLVFSCSPTRTWGLSSRARARCAGSPCMSSSELRISTICSERAGMYRAAGTSYSPYARARGFGRAACPSCGSGRTT